MGVIGAVGAGKSTLLSLLLRLHPVKEGRILINDQSLEDYSLASLRKHLTLVPQTTFLFSETIGHNMSLGLPEVAPEPELLLASEQADLKHEILSLEHQFRAELGERGVNLSGGQKQRMTLARAAILRSDFLLLDDTLSAVDMKTEEKILSGLRALKANGKAVLLVSHRVTALQHADKILVLNQGRLEACGTHNELMRTSKTYQNFARIQEGSDESVHH